MSLSSTFSRILFLFFMVVLGGCGVKGAPTPYVEVYPEKGIGEGKSGPAASVLPSPSPSPLPSGKLKSKKQQPKKNR